MSFKKVENGLISYQISDHANGDEWKNIIVVYNALEKSVFYDLEGDWQLVVIGDEFPLEKGVFVKDKIKVPAISMFVAFQK